MAGRQVCEVPRTSIGGSPFCLAVIYRGMDIQKVCQNGGSPVCFAVIPLLFYAEYIAAEMRLVQLFCCVFCGGFLSSL